MCAHDWANGAAASLDDVLLGDAVAVAVASSTATAAPASNQTRLSMRTLLSYSTPKTASVGRTRRPRVGGVTTDRDRASRERKGGSVAWGLRRPHPGTRKR